MSAKKLSLHVRMGAKIVLVLVRSFQSAEGVRESAVCAHQQAHLAAIHLVYMCKITAGGSSRI